MGHLRRSEFQGQARSFWLCLRSLFGLFHAFACQRIREILRDSDGGGVLKVVNAVTPVSGEKEQNMKNIKVILSIAALGGMFGFSQQVSAQYLAVGSDGIAASPKGRQMLKQTRTVQSAPSATGAPVGYSAVGSDGMAASPKARQVLEASRTVASAPSTPVVSVGYSASGADGLAASPKGRAQLNESSGRIPLMVAPAK